MARYRVRVTRVVRDLLAGHVEVDAENADAAAAIVAARIEEGDDDIDSSLDFSTSLDGDEEAHRFEAVTP